MTTSETSAVPAELEEALKGSAEAGAFFESLKPSYKRRYCEWTGRAKQKAAREARAQRALVMLKNKQKVLKIDSFMDDVGIIKKIDDIPELKEALISLFENKSHKDVSRYGLLLAEHILSLTNEQACDAVKECFEVNKRWQEGKAKVQEARNAAFRIHRLAREEKNPIKEKALRVIGQAAAVPHVKRHALIASDYAVKLVNLMHPKNLEEVKNEREFQIELMKNL